MSTFANIEDPDEMQHSSGSTLFVKVKNSSDKRIEYIFFNFNLTPLDIYN